MCGGRSFAVRGFVRGGGSTGLERLWIFRLASIFNMPKTRFLCGGGFLHLWGCDQKRIDRERTAREQAVVQPGHQLDLDTFIKIKRFAGAIDAGFIDLAPGTFVNVGACFSDDVQVEGRIPHKRNE